MDDKSKKAADDKEKALEQEALKEKALTSPDSSLYTEVEPHNQSPWNWDGRQRERTCSAIRVSNQATRPYDARPQTLPFLREEMEKFIAKGLSAFEGMYWSVLWASSKRSQEDNRYDDDYRGIIVFNTMEIMIRPLRELREGDDGQPKRLHILPLDLKEILKVALEANPGLGRHTTMVIGQGVAKNPEDSRTRNMPDVHFEWRVDLAQKSLVERLVTKWRAKAFGSLPAYRTAQEKYDKEQKLKNWVEARASAPASVLSQSEGLFRSYVPETQREQGPSQAQPSAALLETTPQARKRSNFTLGDDTIPGPSRKRLSTHSQSAGEFRADTRSQSGTSSMGMARPSPVPNAGDLSGRPPDVQRPSQARTGILRRPEASSGAVGRQNTYTGPGYQSQASGSIGSSSSTRPRATLAPMSGVTHGMSNLGLVSSAPTIGRPGGVIIAQPEPRQGEPRGASGNRAPPLAPCQSWNISTAPALDRPRELSEPGARQPNLHDRTLAPLAPHIYNNTTPPRQLPPTLAPLVIPPLDRPQRRTPPRSTAQPGVNFPSVLPPGMVPSQDNRYQSQGIVANSPGRQLLPVSRQDSRMAPQGIWTGQDDAARANPGPDTRYERYQGGSQPAYQGQSGRDGAGSSRS